MNCSKCGCKLTNENCPYPETGICANCVDEITKHLFSDGTDSIEWTINGPLPSGLSYLYLDNDRPTKDAPDFGESAASDNESNPAPKRVI